MMVQHLGFRYSREAVSLIAEGLDDSSSGNEDVPEATDDEELISVSKETRELRNDEWTLFS